MTKQQEILKHIVNLQFQMAQDIESGNINMDYVGHAAEHIESLIDKLN